MLKLNVNFYQIICKKITINSTEDISGVFEDDDLIVLEKADGTLSYCEVYNSVSYNSTADKLTINYQNGPSSGTDYVKIYRTVQYVRSGGTKYPADSCNCDFNDLNEFTIAKYPFYVNPQYPAFYIALKIKASTSYTGSINYYGRHPLNIIGENKTTTKTTGEISAVHGGHINNVDALTCAFVDALYNDSFLQITGNINNNEFKYNSDKVLFLKDFVHVNENDNISDIAEADKISVLTINTISIPCETKDQANCFAAEEINKLNEEKAKTEYLKALESGSAAPQSWIDFRSQRDAIKSLVDSFITDNNLV